VDDAGYAEVTMSWIIVPPDTNLPLMHLWVGVDECICDPDYSVVVSYECVWTNLGPLTEIAANVEAIDLWWLIRATMPRLR
jgi:hypothetical protein